MLFIWGNRRTERKLGYVADRCPICREVRPFRVVRVGLVGHIYYISFGSGKQVGHEMQCEECAVLLTADVTRYASLEKQRPQHLSELTQLTFPNLHLLYATQFAQETELRSAPKTLTPEQRATFLVEPFRILHPGVEGIYAKTPSDKPATLGCLGTVILTVGILSGGIYFQGTVSDNVLLALAIVGGVGVLYTLVQFGLVPGRYLRAHTLPQLARALNPLQPTENELKECLQRCRAIGWKIGSKIKPRQILAAIERLRTDAGRSI